LKNPSLEKDKLIGYTEEGTKKEVALELIQSVRVEKANKAIAYLYYGVAAVAGILLIRAATAPSPPPSECCPFIYSFDGQNYVFDAEPYGGALCQSLKRAEWCGLEHIEETNGYYKIFIANELDETQFTDELKLVVVDHARGSLVVPDASGKFHSIHNPISPLRAVDDKGNDIKELISKKDGVFWETEAEKKDPEKKEDLRDDLIIEFPKPKGVKRAKLFVNVSTSLWGAQVAKQFLKLHGNKINEWYQEINNFGPAYQNIINWFYNKELYLLKVWIKTDNGWKAKGMIFGGGPFISENKAYVLDISDVSDKTLKIKISPPATFWKIDQVAIDYSQDSVVNPQEISSIKAFTQNGQDVLASLIHNDNNYLVMPNKGDGAEVLFPAPSRDKNKERSVFVKAENLKLNYSKSSGPNQTLL